MRAIATGASAQAPALRVSGRGDIRGDIREAEGDQGFECGHELCEIS